MTFNVDRDRGEDTQGEVVSLGFYLKSHRHLQLEDAATLSLTRLTWLSFSCWHTQTASVRVAVREKSTRNPPKSGNNSFFQPHLPSTLGLKGLFLRFSFLIYIISLPTTTRLVVKKTQMNKERDPKILLLNPCVLFLCHRVLFWSPFNSRNTQTNLLCLNPTYTILLSHPPRSATVHYSTTLKIVPDKFLISIAPCCSGSLGKYILPLPTKVCLFFRDQWSQCWERKDLDIK